MLRIQSNEGPPSRASLFLFEGQPGAERYVGLATRTEIGTWLVRIAATPNEGDEAAFPVVCTTQSQLDAGLALLCSEHLIGRGVQQ